DLAEFRRVGGAAQRPRVSGCRAKTSHPVVRHSLVMGKHRHITKLCRQIGIDGMLPCFFSKTGHSTTFGLMVTPMHATQSRGMLSNVGARRGQYLIDLLRM